MDPLNRNQIVKTAGLWTIAGISVLVLGFAAHSIFDQVRAKGAPAADLKALEAMKKPSDYTDALWQLGTTTPGWSERDAHVIVTFRDRMWLMGGLEGNNAVDTNGTIEYWNAPHKSDIWVTDDGLSWDLVTDKAPWGTRRSMSAVEFKNELWVMGGWDNGAGGYNSRIWHSQDGVTWQQATSSANRWPPREGQTVLVYKDKLWLFGGVEFNHRQALNDVWYSEDGVDWYQAPEAPWTPRYDHALNVWHGKIWLSGGKPVGNGPEMSDLWSTEDGMTWKQEYSDAPFGRRHGHMFLPYKDALWIIGGWRGEFGRNDTWWSLDGITWNKTAQDGPWDGREDHMGEVFKDAIWLTGGMTNGFKWNSEVWKFQP